MYPSTEYLNALREHLGIYYPNKLPEKMKVKRSKTITRDYDNSDLYELQWEARGLISEIENSHLLGCNEKVIPHLREEYSVLSDALLLVKNEMLVLKKHQEIVLVMKPLAGLLNKTTHTVLKNDLWHLSQTFGVQL